MRLKRNLYLVAFWRRGERRIYPEFFSKRLAKSVVKKVRQRGIPAWVMKIKG